MIKLSDDDIKRLDVRCMDLIRSLEDVRRTIKSEKNIEAAAARFILASLSMEAHSRELVEKMAKGEEEGQRFRAE